MRGERESFPFFLLQLSQGKKKASPLFLSRACACRACVCVCVSRTHTHSAGFFGVHSAGAIRKTQRRGGGRGVRAPSERARPPTPLSLSFTCRPARRRCRPARPRPGCRGRRRRRRPGRPCSRPRRRRGWQSRGRRRGRWLRGEREEREVSVGSGAVSRRGGGGAQLLSLGVAPPPTARPPPLRGRPPPAGPPPPIARQTNQALTHADGEQDRGQEGDEAHGCWRVKEKREGNQKGGEARMRL